MKEIRLLVDGKAVADAVVADTVLTRTRGLLFRRVLPEALLLRPWGMTAPLRGVTQVLEAPAGSFERWGLEVGSELRLAEALPGEVS